MYSPSENDFAIGLAAIYAVWILAILVHRLYNRRYPPPVQAVDNGAVGELTFGGRSTTTSLMYQDIIVQYEVEHLDAVDGGHDSTMVV